MVVMRKKDTEFMLLVKHLKKKHQWNQRDIAWQLHTAETTISHCMHRKEGYTGEKFVKRLHWIIDEIEGRHQEQTQPESVKQRGLWRCPKCKEIQTPMDITSPVCLNRSCNTSLM